MSQTYLFDIYGLFFTSMQKTYLTDAAPTAFEVYLGLLLYKNNDRTFIRDCQQVIISK